MTSKINAQFILTDKEWDAIEEVKGTIQDIVNEIERFKAFSSSPLEELEIHCNNIVSGIDYLLWNDILLAKGEE